MCTSRHWATLVLLVAACGGDDAMTDGGPNTDGDTFAPPSMHATFEVVSDDGTATLQVPADSLPVGTEPTDLAIRLIDPVRGTDLGEGMFAVVAYDLLPNGIVFAVPATLTIDLDTPADWPLIATLETDEAAVEEVVEVLEIRVTDGDDMTIRQVEAPVAHFSRILFTTTTVGGSHFDLRIEGSDPVVLGGPWSLGIYLQNLRPPGTQRWTSGRRRSHYVVTTYGSWRHRETWAPGAGVTLLTAADTSEVDLTGPSGSSDATFLCETAGTISASVFAYVVREHSWHVELSGSGIVSGPWTATTAFYLPPREVTAECVAPTPDESGGCIDSVSTNTCSFFADQIDVVGQHVHQLTLGADAVTQMFSSTAFECGVSGGGLRTVCQDGALDFPEGGAWVFSTKLAADVLDADAGHSYIYSAVFDSDGNPANDWVFVPPFDYDYFQGTDRWYQLIWNHRTSQWTVTVTQVDDTQATSSSPSAVRAVITGDVVTWFIPSSELPSAAPRYRLSAFGHDGSFSAADRGGDVTGTDPTQPLLVATP